MSLLTDIAEASIYFWNNFIVVFSKWNQEKQISKTFFFSFQTNILKNNQIFERASRLIHHFNVHN